MGKYTYPSLKERIRTEYKIYMVYWNQTYRGGNSYACRRFIKRSAGA